MASMRSTNFKLAVSMSLFLALASFVGLVKEAARGAVVSILGRIVLSFFSKLR